MNVTVVIATCGSSEWERLGDEALRAFTQVHQQRVVRVHLPSGTVSKARNAGLEQVNTEFVCFLDADDALKQGYFDFKPTEDVTATAITYGDRTFPIIPKVWTHERGRNKYHDGECKGNCLPDGNWVHVGAIIRTKTIKAIGGFKEWPVYEDWALFFELQQKGASFGRREQSIYRASVRQTPGHRNLSLPLREKNIIHEKIYETLTGRKYEN